MQHVLLTDVNDTCQNWIIRVRMVRFCGFFLPLEQDKRVRIDAVLLDEQGNTMECHVPEFWIRRSKTKILEDHIYTVRYFEVQRAKKSYRATPHDFMAKFTYHTQLDEIKSVPRDFPLYAHNAVPFNVLRTRIDNYVFTSDALGILTGCSHARDQNTQKSGIRRLRNVNITDESETIGVALWGKHADMFDAETYMEAAVKQPIVILFCGMTCQTFNGNLSLSSSPLCKWYVNPEIREADEIRSSLPADVPPLVWLDAPQRTSNTETKTVTELALLTNPHVINDKRYIVTVKIKEILPDQEWCYLACDRCKKSARHVGDVMQCKDQDCSSTSATIRYRLTMRCIDPETPLSDTTAPSMQLVFFGPTAQELIGFPVHELIEAAGGAEGQLPEQIKSTYGKVLTVQATVGRFSFRSEEVSFQVRNILSIAVTPKALDVQDKNEKISSYPFTELSHETQTQVHKTNEIDKQAVETRAEICVPATPNPDKTKGTEKEVCAVGTPIATTPLCIDRKRKTVLTNEYEQASEICKSNSARRKLDVDVTHDRSSAPQEGEREEPC